MNEQTKAGAVLLPWSCYWREGICGAPPAANIVSFNGEDVIPISYVPNNDDRYAIIHKHNVIVKRLWEMIAAISSGPKLSDYSRVIQIPGNTLDLAPDCSWAHSAEELAKGVRELASTPQPPPEQAGSVGVQDADDWFTQFCMPVAALLKCLPSSFPDGNEHILRKLRAISAQEGFVLVPKEPTDAMCDAGYDAFQDTHKTRSYDGACPGVSWGDSRACYTAMLSAAPAPKESP